MHFKARLEYAGKQTAFGWLVSHQTYGQDDCLIFPFCRLANGYGTLGVGRSICYAHRIMCELVNGPAPPGKSECRHLCGKGHEGCVNPKHLSWGSKSENNIDRRKHGTSVTTRNGNRSPLTREQITQIRALKGKQTQKKTAKQFGISEPNVRRWQSTTHEPSTRRSA